MEKTFTLGDITYTFIPGTAIASCDLDTGDRQNALLCVSVYNGERFEALCFGCEMPTTAGEAADILDDDSAIENDCDSIETFESPSDWQSWDWTGGELAGK